MTRAITAISSRILPLGPDRFGLLDCTVNHFPSRPHPGWKNVLAGMVPFPGGLEGPLFASQSWISQQSIFKMENLSDIKMTELVEMTDVNSAPMEMVVAQYIGDILDVGQASSPYMSKYL
jgi:hypothetical protein